MDVTIFGRDRLRIHTSASVTLNEGASFGPRISTARFSIKRGLNWRTATTATLWADLDGRLWQDEADVRRRAAQALIAPGRRAAASILSGALAPAVEGSERAPGIWQVTFMTEETTDGFARRARVQFGIETDKEPAVPAEANKAAGQLLKTLADALHVSLEMPENRLAYYGSTQIA